MIIPLLHYCERFALLCSAVIENDSYLQVKYVWLSEQWLHGSKKTRALEDVFSHLQGRGR